MFGGGSIFLKPHFGEGHFLKNAFEGRATIFLAHKYSVSIYLKSSNSQFTLFEPTVSALLYVITRVNVEHCFTKSLYEAYLFSKTHNN